jgi:leucyl-tRNA synthetase
MRFAGRFLNNLWDYALDRIGAAAGSAPADAEAENDTAFMRERLVKWCDNGIARITEDLAELQMHKAVRNVTRLFERIQDYEKRVVERRGQLSRADAEALAEALVLLDRVLAPFAPHFAEALLIEAGREDELESLGRWPQPVESLS